MELKKRVELLEKKVADLESRDLNPKVPIEDVAKKLQEISLKNQSYIPMKVEKMEDNVKENKKIEPAELIYKQIVLLAKESQQADSKDLVEISDTMANLYIALNTY